ncbi:hypothetical protein HN371_22425 [Candidatus Poribacteria bacterium]|nr:hypothetical protein [Candidatus Poribacteria bacterium]MBT7808662.1 hypothetical protein [Candidatus Poribacteria bacterium]
MSEAVNELGIGERAVYRRVAKGRLEKRINAEARVEIGIPTDENSSPNQVRRQKPVVGQTSEPVQARELGQTSEPDQASGNPVATGVSPPQSDLAWRDDLLAQIARIERDKELLTNRLTDMDGQHAAAVASMQSRHQEALTASCDALEAQLEDACARRDQEEGRAARLEAELRETLRESEQRTAHFADRIADLVQQVEDTRGRIIELQPVAEQVPMLQAAVEERDETLSDMRDEVARIESGVISGPIFRMLTKNGRLRR